jgi:hypothetical protein
VHRIGEYRALHAVKLLEAELLDRAGRRGGS